MSVWIDVCRYTSNKASIKVVLLYVMFWLVIKGQSGLLVYQRVTNYLLAATLQISVLTVNHMCTKWHVQDDNTIFCQNSVHAHYF